ncbi:hypothetical protein Tco_0503810 [Tanacetum coccineum]
METQKLLLKDEDGKEVDVYLYRSMIGSLRYALTINPTIYTLCIEQLWATVKVKTVNGEVQLQALVDGKKIIVTEASVRHDLQRIMRKGTDCLPNATILKNVTRKYNVADKAVYEEMGDSLERAATTATSLDAEQDRSNINKTQSKATPNEPSSLGTISGGGPRRQDTMGDTITQTGFENVSKTSNDPLLAREHKDCSILGDYKFKTESQEVREEWRIKNSEAQKLYKVGRSTRIVSSDEASLGNEEDASKHGRKIDDIDKDAKITWVDETQGRYGDDIMFDVSDLASEEVFVAEQGVPDSKKDYVVSTTGAATTVKLKSAKPTIAASTRPKDKGLVIHEEEQATTLTVSSQQPSQEKIQDKGKGIMVEEPLKMKKKDQIKIAQESSSKRAGTELEQESIKKQKLDEDKEIAELQRLIEVVLDKEEVTIDSIPMATKPPSIIDYKIHKRKKTYYQIIRTDGSSKMYLVFSHMLKSFDREDLETLWKLVKAKHGSTRPEEGYERLLWGDLKTMFIE